MLIKEVKINCYKSIKEPMILNLSAVNIFIGQNNSGKSNVLDALEFTLWEQPTDSTIFYEKADIELLLEFSDEELQRYDLPASTGKFILREGQRELISGGKTIKHDKALTKFFATRFKRLDEQAFFNFKQIEEDFHILANYPFYLEKFKQSLKRHFPKISATENALDIRYENDGLYEGERRVTIDRLGTGFQRIFIILLYIFHPQYTVVLINEPETHLHPGVIKKLLWAMQNSQAGQVIFTTHSPLFVTPLTLPQVVRIVKDGQTTRAFSLASLQYNPQRLLQELNADNLEIFFADKVILVEGVSDRLLLRGLIDRFYHGDKDIKVVETHGKGNMKIYLDLLDVFQIPFIIILDRDALRTNHIQEIIQHLEIKLDVANENELLVALKKYGVFVFPNGSLENNYPRKYQNEESKSLNALHAATLITESDWHSQVMDNLREIISSI